MYNNMMNQYNPNMPQYSPNPYSTYNNLYQPKLDQIQNNLLRVNGLDGAKAYQMMPNSTVALFDANEDIFYVKTSDAGGFSQIKSFRFIPVEEQKPTQIDTNQFVTRQEFEELKGELLNGKQSVQKSNKAVKSTTDTEN